MRNANTTCLIGRPLHADLEARLEIPVRVANDANCFALAEALLGAAKGYRTVFGVIMGTGVGGGVVVDGKVLDGKSGITGEWGHNLLEPDGEPCYCGKQGCVETVLSGPALERWHLRQTGEAKKLKEIAAENGLAVGHACAEFGRALSVVVNILDPDAIVLGGGVSNLERLYTDGEAALTANVFHDDYLPTILRPHLGDSAGVFGAAMLT
jgi:predicted NBD/HSP70 family sugar kinase